MPSTSLKVLIGGMVDSPTPTVPIASDSTSCICNCLLKNRASMAAAIQPEEPPPTISTRFIDCSVIVFPTTVSPAKKKPLLQVSTIAGACLHTHLEAVIHAQQVVGAKALVRGDAT